MKRASLILLFILCLGLYLALGDSGRIEPAATPAIDTADAGTWAAWQLSDASVPSAKPAVAHDLSRPVKLPETLPATQTPARFRLPLTAGTTWQGDVIRTHRHANGDRTFVAGSRPGERAVITIGLRGVFARVRHAGRTFEVSTRESGSWLVDLTDPRLDVDHFGHDAIAAADSDRSPEQSPPWQPPPAAMEQHQGESALIDVMFLHTPEMAERYPGELLETRINHLVAIANQSLVDSRIRAQVRLTGLEQTRYSRRQDNASALRDLRDALAGESIPGLEGLLGRRLLYDADLVVLTWPHDIETRGACGIAYYPQIEANGQPRREFGVQISNDGASNWSVCSDAVFTHELGHNLGAQHQRETIQSPDPQASNFAWTRAGRWHTVMGSFGTGHVDRYRRLDLFSNPAVQCGGEACGSMTAGGRADNAGHMNALAPTVAAYFGAAGQTAEHPDRSQPDTDGDGVPDRDDPYPFDADDAAGPTEPLPSADYSPRPLATGEATEYELLLVSSGNDRVLSFGLDGRYRGPVAEPAAVNAGPILTGYSDLLADGAGRLYLLASEDVRRFDRLSGRLIDVFLDSALPGPRELQSAFPRAMGWLGNGRLAVLGDNAIEIYDGDGRRLNPTADTEPGSEPSNWSDPVDLPLRAMVRAGDVVFVAEAATPRVMSFSASQGMRGDDVADEAARLVDPRDMAVGPDGLVYVANGAASNVLRFDPQTLRFVDEFIPAGLGGLDFARALAFGPDGDLFVSSRDSHAVLRFDGVGGQFLGVVADAAAAPIDTPESLVIAPVVDQVGAGHSGHYFVPARSGEGWLLEILDEQRAAISWFTYPPQGAQSGEQAWVVGVGEIRGRRIVFDDMLATRLTDAAAPIGAENITQRPWGRLELDFGHCGFGQAHYDSPLFDDSGTLDFSRLITIEGLPCGGQPRRPVEAAPGISGQWNDPDSSGQGWFLQEVGAGRVFAAWFTYDERGEQSWIVGEGRLEGRTLRFDDLVLTRGAAFGSDFQAEDVERIPWGELEFRFHGCDSATAEYTSELTQYGSGVLRPERLTALDRLDCALPD